MMDQLPVKIEHKTYNLIYKVQVKIKDYHNSSIIKKKYAKEEIRKEKKQKAKNK